MAAFACVTPASLLTLQPPDNFAIGAMDHAGGVCVGGLGVAKGDPMPKNSSPPICPKCSMPMRFVLVKTGGRKFRCVDCDVTGLLKLPEFTQLLTGELRHPG